MDSDERCSNGCRNVHWATITTNDQVCPLQERNELGQACFTGQVDSLLLHLVQYALN